MHHFGLVGDTALILYIGAIVAFLLSIVWKPEIGLYYLIPLLPMQTVRYRLHDLPLGEKLVDIILLGVLVGLLLHAKRPIFVASPLNKAILIFCVITYVGLWEGSLFHDMPLPLWYTDARFSDWKNYVEMLLIFFVAAAALRTPKQMTIAIALMCISVLLVNRSYHSTIGDRDFSHFSYELRDAGTLGFAGENGMGAFQSQFAVFFLALGSFAKKKYVRWGLYGIALTCIYCLVLTLSRGSYFGFLVGILVLGFIKERKYLLMLVILMFSWQAVVPRAVQERVLMTYEEEEGLDSSAQERVDLWQDALQVIGQNPVLGTGFDTYKFMGRVGPYQDTHNYYLKVFLELGLVGLLLFFWLIVSAFRLSWRLFRCPGEDPLLTALGCALVATLSCTVLVNLFGDRWSYLQVNGFLWVLLGMAARGLWLRKEESGKAEVPSQIRSSSPRIPLPVSHA